ncbi:CopG family transcriptional regulator [Halovenus sp. WSH3]|uniref:CopG family transcriptional regulator n=1 Tax=Halovenus carboxidivorans TaxID=2692199 RepID=A0A6B0TBY9_9EURY|nr:zinc ribbon domain-containing protein [Halovenus carboxidivorans]MXR50719.1 CopG family transcriptional regulator [Halovenus carboxidivorans]
MSKITFRADDELITQLEEFDASKSEVMRRALREYLETHGDDETVVTEPTDDSDGSEDSPEGSLDDLVADRVDAIIADRLDNVFTPAQPQDVNVNISVEGQAAPRSPDPDAEVNTSVESSHASSNDVSHEAAESKTGVDDTENARVQHSTTCAKCGENVEPSHVYCPNCGEKTSHRVFCECGDEIRSDWSHCPSCGRRTPAADVLDQS